MSDELAEALDSVWAAIGDGEVPAVDASLPIVMAEFDRLRLVEQAAREVVRHFNTDAEMSRNFGLDERISNLEDALSTERTWKP